MEELNVDILPDYMMEIIKEFLHRHPDIDPDLISYVRLDDKELFELEITCRKKLIHNSLNYTILSASIPILYINTKLNTIRINRSNTGITSKTFMRSIVDAEQPALIIKKIIGYGLPSIYVVSGYVPTKK